MQGEHSRFDLMQPYRLLFIPANDPLPRVADGGIDQSLVTEIEILPLKIHMIRKPKEEPCNEYSGINTKRMFAYTPDYAVALVSPCLKLSESAMTQKECALRVV
jgi:hypothetical protein